MTTPYPHNGGMPSSQRTPEPRLSKERLPVDVRRELLSGLTPSTRGRLKRDEVKSDSNQGLQQGQDVQPNLLPEADLNLSRPLYGNYVKAVFHDKLPPVTEPRRTERGSPVPNMNFDPTLAPPGMPPQFYPQNMGPDPNSNPMMRPPSSRPNGGPQFNGQPMTQEQMQAMRQMDQNDRRVQQRTAQQAFMHRQQQQAMLAYQQDGMGMGFRNPMNSDSLSQQREISPLQHALQLQQMEAQQKAIALQHAQPQSSNHSQAGNQESNPEKLSQNLQNRQREAQRQYGMRLQQQQQQQVQQQQQAQQQAQQQQQSSQPPQSGLGPQQQTPAPSQLPNLPQQANQQAQNQMQQRNSALVQQAQAQAQVNAARNQARQMARMKQLGDLAGNNTIVDTSLTRASNKRRRPLSDSLFHRSDGQSSTITNKQTFNSVPNTISEDCTRDSVKRRKAKLRALGQHNSQ
ncbi:unnamed protein product [Alternaria sp. RS040]